MKLREITYGDIYSYRNERLETKTRHNKPRKIASTNRELSYLRRIFNIGLRQGFNLINPVTNGENLIDNSAERIRARILSIDEEVKLLAACENPKRKHLKPLLIFLLDTACRKSEAIQLIWEDVDLNNRLITIQAMNTKTLKTRQVGITGRLFFELERLWSKSDQKLSSRVFGINKSVRTAFTNACKEAGIKEGGIDGFTLHSTRHTALSRLAKNGLPLAMVSKIAGHSSPNFTYQKYLTMDTDTLYQAASILESIQQTAAEENSQTSETNQLTKKNSL
jgi:integrase